MMTLKKKISTILTTWLALTASFFGFSLFQSPSSAKTIESRLKDVREQTALSPNDQGSTGVSYALVLSNQSKFSR